MKKIDFGQTINSLANVGVILGIAFLAFEINQNNRLLRAEAESNYLDRRIDNRRGIIADPEVAEFWLRVEQGEALSDVDERRLRAQMEATYLTKQWEYSQMLDGNLSEDRDLLIRRFREEHQAMPKARMAIFADTWSALRRSLRDDFVQFMEDNVFSQ